MWRRPFSIIFRKISTSGPPKLSPRRIINVAFGKYLFLTNTVSSGVLMFLGDIVQQEIEYQEKKLEKRYDYGRLARMFLVGLGMGPVHHFYYNYINSIYPQRDWEAITKKILLDQFVMSPICIAQFFYSMGFLEKRSLESMNHELKDKFVEIYTVDWMIWPPTQFLNFYLVPVKYQVFYINSITMLYNVFLSYIKHRDYTPQQMEKVYNDN